MEQPTVKHLKPNKSLEYLAKRYVWWESPSWALEHPELFLANVMNLGNWGAFCKLHEQLDDDTLREVLKNAPPGSFSYQSWDYWHYKLGYKNIPPLPTRKFI